MGYQTYAMGKGTHLISIPFEDLAAEDGTFPIQSIRGNLNKGVISADQVLVWDPETVSYTVYQWKGETLGWVKRGESTSTADVIKPTQSVFFARIKEGEPFTVAGQVCPDATTTLTLSKGMTFIANPYPTALPIASIQGTFATGVISADQILRWDTAAKAYVVYCYTTNGWVKRGESAVTEDTIAPGEGFIFGRLKSSGTSTMIFDSPITE